MQAGSLKRQGIKYEIPGDVPMLICILMMTSFYHQSISSIVRDFRAYEIIRLLDRYATSKIKNLNPLARGFHKSALFFWCLVRGEQLTVLCTIFPNL